jgi:drug/metabolite transporter (DMT)-like permease
MATTSALDAARDRVTERSRGIVGVSLATVMWGLLPLVLKQIEMPILSFAAWRLWSGVAVYGIALLISGRRLRWGTLKACGPGGLFFAADLAVTFGAFRLTSAANATIIGSLSVVLISIGGVRWFGERMARRDGPFVLTSLVGVALVALGAGGATHATRFGDLLALIGAFTWASFWLFSKRARARSGTGALEYMATVMLLAAPLLTVAALASGASLGPPRGWDLSWLVLVTLLPGACGHLLVAWSHRHLEAWLGSLITLCVPVVAGVAAWLVLGESLTVLTVAGGLLVLGATACLLLRSRSAPMA